MNEIFKLNDETKSIQEDMKVVDEALGIAELFRGTDVDFGNLKSNILTFRAFVTGKRHAETIKSRIENRKVRNETIEKVLSARDVMLFIAYETARTKEVDDSIKDIEHQELDITNKYLDSKAEDVTAAMEKAKKSYVSRLDEIKKRFV